MNIQKVLVIAAFGWVVFYPARLMALEPESPAREVGQAAPLRFDAHLGVGWYSAFGVGGRVDIPLVPQGLIRGTTDDISVSAGAELFWFYDSVYNGVGVVPVGAFQWNFYLGEKWSLFPEIGLALMFAPHRDRYWSAFVAPVIGLGARHFITTRNALLFRLSWPTGLQVGITF